MLRIDKDGMVRNALVRLRRFSSLERAPMPVVNGVIVHQTGAATAQSTFNSYQQGTSWWANTIQTRSSARYAARTSMCTCR